MSDTLLIYAALFNLLGFNQAEMREGIAAFFEKKTIQKLKMAYISNADMLLCTFPYESETITF